MTFFSALDRKAHSHPIRKGSYSTTEKKCRGLSPGSPRLANDCSVFKGSALRLLALQVLVIRHHPVNELPFGSEVKDPVTHRLDQLVVMGGNQHIALDCLQTVVQCGDGLQIQVVGGLVQQEHVGPGQHHPGQHTPHLLAAGEHP